AAAARTRPSSRWATRRRWCIIGADRMARRRTVEEQLAAIHGLRAAPGTAETVRELRAALRSRTGLVAAAAAAVSGAPVGDALTDELEAGFARSLGDPIRRDPRRAAKQAFARARVELGRWSSGVVPAGIRHVQLEPVFGGREDTAAPLRGMSA